VDSKQLTLVDIIGAADNLIANHWSRWVQAKIQGNEEKVYSPTWRKQANFRWLRKMQWGVEYAQLRKTVRFN